MTAALVLAVALAAEPPATAPETAPEAAAAPEPAPPPPPEATPAAGSDAATVRRFADHLLAIGDAYRAIGEYRRYLFLAPDAPDAASAKLAIGRAYLAGGRAADAAAWFDVLAAEERDEARLGAWRWYAGLCRLEDGDHAGAVADLEEAARILPGKRGRALLLSGFALAAQDRDEAAVARLREAAGVAEVAGPARAIADELARRDELTAYRSPVAAGVLSAVIPGAGHVYVGDVGLGLAALAWNGVFGFGLYETIRHELWGLTATVGVVTALFYAGGITGAVSAAHKFNRDARLNHLDDLERRYPVLDPLQPD